MPPTYTFTDSPLPAEIDAVERDLTAFFEDRGAGPKDQKLAVLVRTDDGALIGGLLAKAGWDQCYIATLFVAEAARGQGIGTRMIDMVLEEARRRGLHSAWLMTSTDEGKRFYEKLGFECFGAVGRHPPSSARWFMKKTL